MQLELVYNVSIVIVVLFLLDYKQLIYSLHVQLVGIRNIFNNYENSYYGVKDTNGIVSCKLCTSVSDAYLRC